VEKSEPLSSYQPEEGGWGKGELQKKKCRAHTVLLHDGQELNDDLGRRADEDLALARLLGVVDGVERIVEDGGFDHIDGGRRFSMAFGRSRYLWW